MKKLILSTVAFSFLSFPIAQAAELTVGGQIGALSLVEGETATDLGYGAFIQASAFSNLGLQLDYMRTEFKDVGSAKVKIEAQGISPNLTYTLVNFEEFRIGVLGGPGFFKLGDDSWRFGLSGGAFGEVSFIKNFPIGLQTRYHAVLGGRDNDLWSIMLTAGFRFDLAGGDNDW